MMRVVFLSVVVFVLQAVGAYAQEQSSEPVHISATGTLEWQRDQKQYVANGDVIVKQGDTELYADRVVADYEEAADDQKEKGGMNIYRFTATGNVVIKTPTETATGTRAVYERKSDIATLDGPVTITKGQDVLKGARAIVNLTTKKSTLVADEKQGGRVSGVFYNTGGK